MRDYGVKKKAQNACNNYPINKGTNRRSPNVVVCDQGRWNTLPHRRLKVLETENREAVC